MSAHSREPHPAEAVCQVMLLGVPLYRSLLREARNLPDRRVSQHYRDRIRTLFRHEPEPESSLQAVRRVKRAQKLLRHLQAANDGYLHAITRTIEHAYGIRGKEKHLALQPYTSLGLVEGKAKHSFTPPLAALVTSSVAHTTRAPTPSQLLNPPTLPARADPTSEDARLLGQLIPQRIRAIKRRYWNSQTGKLRAPVALRLHTETGEVVDPEQASALLEKYASLDVPPRAIASGRARLSELVAKADTPTSSGPLPPRRLQTPDQRATRKCRDKEDSLPRSSSPESRVLRVLKPSAANSKWHLPKSVTPRLLRRRMQESLAQAPIMEIKLASSQKEEGDACTPKYSVVRHEAAKGEKGRYRLQSAEERWWQEQANLVTAASDASKKKKKRKDV